LGKILELSLVGNSRFVFLFFISLFNKGRAFDVHLSIKMAVIQGVEGSFPTVEFLSFNYRT
jgi:hypothetical protein